MTLAASFFLKALETALSNRLALARFADLHLFEGFASFKMCGLDVDSPSSTMVRITHVDEALALANAVTSAADLDPTGIDRTQSILGTLGMGGDDTALPAVIDISPGEVPQGGSSTGGEIAVAGTACSCERN